MCHTNTIRILTSSQCAELDIMHQEINDKLTPTIRAIQYQLTPKAHTNTNTNHTAEPCTLDQVNADHKHATQIAQTHGYATVTALAPHIKQLNLEDAVFLTTIHNEWAHILRLTPQPTQHSCPLCAGHAKLYYRNQDNRYICKACDGAWTPPQLVNAQRLVIQTAGKWITRKEAREKYGYTRNHLRQLIHRGILIQKDGLIYEPQLATRAPLP